jgi:hypothetical protein
LDLVLRSSWERSAAFKEAWHLLTRETRTQARRTMSSLILGGRSAEPNLGGIVWVEAGMRGNDGTSKRLSRFLIY